MTCTGYDLIFTEKSKLNSLTVQSLAVINDVSATFYHAWLINLSNKYPLNVAFISNLVNSYADTLTFVAYSARVGITI